MIDFTIRESGRRTLPSAQQAFEAIRGYTAYFGTYTVNVTSSSVTHHRQSGLNMSQPDFVRRYEFTSEGHLALVPVDNPAERLEWAPVKGDV